MFIPALTIFYPLSFVCVYGNPRPGYSYPPPSVRVNDQTIAGHKSYSVGGLQSHLDLPETFNGGGLISLNSVPSDPIKHSYPSLPNRRSKSSDNVYTDSYDNAVTIQKHIYIHVPPVEEHLSIPKTIPVQTKQIHYKIIFIKTPSPQTPTAKVIPVQVQDKEKTLVYVLVKKPEELPDIHIPTPIPTTPSKPEVYFIKYTVNKEVVGGDISEVAGADTITEGAGSGTLTEGGDGLPIVEDAFRSSSSSISDLTQVKTSVLASKYGPPSIKH